MYIDTKKTILNKCKIAKILPKSTALFIVIIGY